MNIVRAVIPLRDALREVRQRGGTIALVPTMGAFHEGHLALMRHAKARCDHAVVSLFVNPAQFNDPRDLERYPRDAARDEALAATAGVDLLFAPPVEEVYPAGFATQVEVPRFAAPLEGAKRGVGHFRGVATVVTKLLNMVQPDVAVFGQKDAQQALLVRRMVRDLDLPVAVDVRPTVREPDGLAMSSRNVRLDAAARARAVSLSRALFAVEAAVQDGERDVARALAAGIAVLDAAGIEAEYLSAVDADTLEPVTTVTGPTLVPIAAHVGGVRLIDNVLVDPLPA